jgi:hypothetical protein
MIDKEGKYFAAVMVLNSIVITIIATFLVIHALWFALADAQSANEYLTKRVQELSRTCGREVTHARQCADCCGFRKW